MEAGAEGSDIPGLPRGGEFSSGRTELAEDGGARRGFSVDLPLGEQTKSFEDGITSPSKPLNGY